MIQQLYDTILSEIKDDVNIDFLTLEALKTNNNYSIRYNKSSLLCRIHLSQKQRYISFPKDHIDLFTDFSVSRIKSEPDFIRVSFDTIDDIKRMKDAFIAIIKALPVPIAFDVCSRYQQCSDALQCVDPDPQHALGCSYKRKLEKGIVFFGKNRNVD